MYSVTYRNERKKTSQYKTENGALRAIWKWLKVNVGSAILIGPGHEPRVYTDSDQLPFVEPKEPDFYSSVKWLRLRVKAFELYGNECSCCGAVPKSGVRLHVDHIKPRSLYPQLELEIENLQVLCEQCNVGKSNLSETKWR